MSLTIAHALCNCVIVMVADCQSIIAFENAQMVVDGLFIIALAWSGRLLETQIEFLRFVFILFGLIHCAAFFIVDVNACLTDNIKYGYYLWTLLMPFIFSFFMHRLKVWNRMFNEEQEPLIV